MPSINYIRNVWHLLEHVCSKQKKIILSLENKANDTKVELEKVKKSAWNKCQTHESKFFEFFGIKPQS